MRTSRQTRTTKGALSKSRRGSVARRMVRIQDSIGFILAGLALALLVSLAISYKSVQANAGPAVNMGPGKHPMCDANGLPVCPSAAASTQWISIPSESPSVVKSAITSSGMFASVETRLGHLTLDTPALVRLLPTGVSGSAYWTNDHWLASAMSNEGQRVCVFDFIYDRAHHRIEAAVVGYLEVSDPRSKQAFPYSTPSSAIQRVAAVRGAAAASGIAPILVFFPPNSTILGPDSGRPPHAWSGGGEYPSDPMWMVTGANGHAYFVGKDARIYDQSALPVA